MAETATFGAGCFWGVEAAFQRVPGVIDTAVGYGGGHTENPTYQDVCSDETGHAEVVQVTFDPAKVSYEQLLNVFWQIHDPTQVNRQGQEVARDCGSQRQIPATHCDRNYSRRKVLPRGRISPEVLAKARRRLLPFLIDVSLGAAPLACKLASTAELKNHFNRLANRWNRKGFENRRARCPKRASRARVPRENKKLRAAHFCARGFSVTGCGSANCSQKPIISSSLGSPQRTALDGSGFKALFFELSK